MEQVKRVNYFQGMMLVDEDFRDEQNYHRQMLGNHNLELHTWGVVRGLEVSIKAGALDVTEGMAIGADGKEIWWKGGDPKPTGTASDGGYIIIEWSEQLSDEYSQMPGKYLRLIDTCTFSFKSPIEPGDVVLATIRVQGGQIQAQMDNSVRRTASSVRVNQDNNNLEIRPVTKDGSLRLMTGAPLTERLTIAATGNVGIGTTGPDAAKLVVDTAGGTMSSLKCEHRGSNFIVRPQSAGANSTVIENTTGGALLINPGGGYVGIGTNNALEKLDVGSDIRINDHDLYFTDKNHGIGFYGSGKTFGGANLNGPAVYGSGGGALGSKAADGQKVVLRWNELGNVGIGTTSPEEQLQIGEGIYKIGIGTTPGDGMMNGRTQSLWNAAYGTAYLGFNAVRTNLGWRRGDESGKRGASIIYNTLYGDLCFVTVEPEGNEYLTAGDIVSRRRMVIDRNGNVGIGKPLDKTGTDKGFTGRLNVIGSGGVEQGLQFDNREIKFRGDGFTHFSIFANRVSNALTFDVSGSNLGMNVADSNIMTLAVSGNVGIGTTQPKAKLDIQGGADSGGASDPNAMAFSYRNGGFRHWIRTRHNATLDKGNAIDFYVNNSTAADGSSAPTTGTLHVMTLDTGKVGIGGVTEPKETLDVGGDIRLSENNLYFKDKSHGIGYYGGNKKFNAEDIDGPVVYGVSGGALGSNQNLQTGAVQKIALRWDTEGNVAVGKKLKVSNAIAGFGLEPSDVSPNAGYIRFGDKTGWKLHFGQASSGGSTLTGLSGVIMTLQDQGKVGIGTTSPDAPLEIKGTQSEVKVKFGGTGGDVHHLSSNRDLVFNSTSGMFSFRKVDTYGDVSKFTDLMTINANGNISSPKWNVTSVINQSGPLNINKPFSTGGGRLVIFASGSAFRTNAGTIGMYVYLDGNQVGVVKGYTNEDRSHKSLVSFPIVVERIVAGSHTIELRPLATDVYMDGNDYFNVTILELPF